MKLQTSTMLALYSVLEAASNPQRQLSAADIAHKYRISSHHLAKVLRELGRAGIVESSRGAGGGFRLVANARRLTLMDVIELFEGISTSAQDSEQPLTGAGRALARVLSEVDQIAMATFRSITIDTMLKLIEREPLVEERKAKWPESRNAA